MAVVAVVSSGVVKLVAPPEMMLARLDYVGFGRLA